MTPEQTEALNGILHKKNRELEDSVAASEVKQNVYRQAAQDVFNSNMELKIAVTMAQKNLVKMQNEIKAKDSQIEILNKKIAEKSSLESEEK